MVCRKEHTLDQINRMLGKYKNIYGLILTEDAISCSDVEKYMRNKLTPTKKLTRKLGNQFYAIIYNELVDFMIKRHQKELDAMIELKYPMYLRTRFWRARKYFVIKYYGDKCCKCGNTKRLNVHHKSYLNVPLEKLSDLLVLCEECHKKIHNIDRERKY